MASERLRIGIPGVGGSTWGGDVRCVELLARAVHTLEPDRRPELHLVLRPEDLAGDGWYVPLLELFHEVILLADPGADAAAWTGRPGAAHPFALCANERELYQRVDFFFPVIGDGWAEGCSASWIPDFQHRHQRELFDAGELARREDASARVASRAKLVALGSDGDRQDFCRFFPQSPARTRVLPFPSHPAGDRELKALGEAFLALASEAVRLFSLAAHGRRAAASDTDRAEQAWREGRTGEALEILQDVVAGHPDDARAAYTLGLVLRAIDQSDLAMQHFRSAIRSNPAAAAPVLSLGELLLEKGRVRQACDGYYRFLDHEPDNDDVIGASVRAEERWADELMGRSLVRDLGYQRRGYRVSALVSTYASAEFIGECLEDLLAQSIADEVEIIVVDAASPQDERAIVESFQRRCRNIRYLRTPERIGIYPAWNLAVRASCGEFLTSASTNDRLGPEAYQQMSLALRERPEVALVYGDSHLTEVPHQRFGAHTPSRFRGGAFRWPPFRFEDLLHNCLVGPHPMWRRSAHQEAGYFDGRYRAIGDQDFWNRLGWKRPLLHVPVFTGLAWITPASLSGRPSAMAETHEIKAKHRRYHQRVGATRPVPRSPDPVPAPADPPRVAGAVASLLPQGDHGVGAGGSPGR